MRPPLEVVPSFIDGYHANAVIDLEQEHSFMSFRFLSRISSTPHLLRRVEIPSIANETHLLSMTPCHFYDDSVDIVLGRDWYRVVSARSNSLPIGLASSSSMLTTVNHSVALFYGDIRTGDGSLFNCSDDTLMRNAAMHGISVLGCSSDVVRTRLVRHLFCGMCTDVHSGRAGCNDVIQSVRSYSRCDIASYFVSRLMQLGARSVIDAALVLTCRSLFPSLAYQSDMCSADYAHLLLMFARMFGDLLTWNSAIRLQDVEGMSADALRLACAAHGLSFIDDDVDELRNRLAIHLLGEDCRKRSTTGSPTACQDFNDDYTVVSNGFRWTRTERCSPRFNEIEAIMSTLPVKSLRRLASVLGINVEPGSHSNRIRRLVKLFILRHRKGKTNEMVMVSSGHPIGSTSVPCATPPTWPRVTPLAVKNRVLALFRRATGKDMLQAFTCAACGGNRNVATDRIVVDPREFDLSILRRNEGTDYSGLLSLTEYGQLSDLVVEPRGVRYLPGGRLELDLCRTCHSSIRRGVLPVMSLANDMVLGEVPQELSDLTPVEESLIARCRAKSWIVHLRNCDVNDSVSQRGMKGHIIVYPQHPEGVRKVLPPSPDELSSYICVVFVGPVKPSHEWLNEHASPLLVRQDRVRRALRFLKDNNRLYADISIDEHSLSQLPENAVLPFEVQHETSTTSANILTDSYDHAGDNPGVDAYSNSEEAAVSTFSGVIVSDVNEAYSLKERKQAAMQHLKDPRKSHIAMPHDPVPVSEFDNPDLFPCMYPTLYPYGRGGFELATRTGRPSMDRHVRHLLNMTDKRFQEHFSFIFVAFNILQRRKALLHSKFKVESAHFKRVVNDINSVDADTIRSVVEKLDRGERIAHDVPEEARVLRLMREVKLVTAHVDGSSSARTAMRNEIRGMMITHGMPSFFLTINPADVYNPILKFMAGSDIDVDNLLPADVPKYREQSLLVAKNPVLTAKFFDLVMRTFIKNILGFDCDDELIQKEGGVLGKVRSYYGCVEAQGRGSLHCHMLVWIDGAKNPNEIRDLLLKNPGDAFAKELTAMLDDVITNDVPCLVGSDVEVPSDNHHPCSVRSLDSENPLLVDARSKDMINLVKHCQIHSHSHTCYKYWRGPPEPKECRFDLDKDNVRPCTTVDPETGELTLRCLNGLVNNFNCTMLEAIRSNMDLKFIGSGQSAKAVLYYITDYITKTQLKAHVAFAALELAAKRLEAGLATDDEPLTRAKRLLQKCAYAMISHQELSAQQVSAYLLGTGDKYTNGAFKHLWWTSFESAVNVVSPLSKDGTVPPVTGIDMQSDTPELHRNMSDLMLGEQEVGLVNDDGHLVSKCGQVADYIHRDADLSRMNVWDFLSVCEKVRLRPAEVAVEGVAASESHEGSRDLNKYIFSEFHDEHRTHCIRIVPDSRKSIPVPIGPSIPRRDRPDVRERYCRLMVILFEPWKDPRSLRKYGESWEAAFVRLRVSWSPSVHRMLENMQLLHECRDSRNDHFANRRNRAANRVDVVQTRWLEGAEAECDDPELCGEELTANLIEHLQSISASTSRIQSQVDSLARDCLDRMDTAGLMDFSDAPQLMSFSDPDECFSEDVSNIQDALQKEADWKQAYRDIKTSARQRLNPVRRDIPQDLSDAPHVATETMGHHGTEPYIRSHDSDCTAVVDGRPSTGPSHSTVDEMTVEHLIREFALNREQEAAFRLTCNRATNARLPQLRMYIGGPGGTGKSRVVQAISTFFQQRGELRRIRLAAYTGVAASNVGGVTLHSALMLNQDWSKRGARMRQELAELWDGVDFLVIDEVSMIGCEMLYQIHYALTIAKGKDLPFGGVNVIFAGDFAQLPPIGQPKLFTNVRSLTQQRVSTEKGQRCLLGRLLWLGVDRVVMLHRPMRQSQSESGPFVDLLARLRDGTCNDADYALLQGKVISADTLTEGNVKQWTNVIVLVTDNASKDAINSTSASRFVSAQGRSIETYESLDTHQGVKVADGLLRSELARYNTGKTAYRAQSLTLSPGMPVLLSQNYDVAHGAVNGTFGRVRSVRYRTDSTGSRIATSCVIEASTYSGRTLPHLRDHEIAVLPDTVDIKFIHPSSKKTMTIKRSQLPVLPAFAMTVHKAQGLTLDKAIVDLDGCHGTEAAYVMLSRVRRLEDLLILRPFDKKRIQSRPSEDRRREFNRLRKIHQATMGEISSDHTETELLTADSLYGTTLSRQNLVDAISRVEEALLL